MTIAPPAKTSHPLSPFQRAALAYAARPIVVTVTAPVAATVLIERAERALRTMPQLSACLHYPPASKLPHQQLADITRETLPGGELQLNAGALSLIAAANASGARLTIAADALFADAASIELLCERIADGGDGGTSANFFDVAAEHDAMLREGELDQEKAYWQSRHGAVDPRAALGVDAGTTGTIAAASVPIDLPALAPFAGGSGALPGDVLYLALHLLVDRVCASARIGRLVDTRELMGLEGTPGAFSQVVPDAIEIDPDESASSLLARQSERLREQAQMAGGPALVEGSQPPTLIFDPRPAWRVPDGWRVSEAFEARTGAVLLRGSLDNTILTLTANACDGIGADTLQALLKAWAEIAAALVHEPERPWRSLPLGPTWPSHGPLPPSPSRSEPSQSEPSQSEPSQSEPSQSDVPPIEDLCARVRALAAHDPDAVAIRQGAWTLSRQALMNRIGAIAAAIGQLESDAVVAVLSGPEPNLVAAWIAVMWRRAAFLPLLPAEPRQRIENALAASGAAAVLVADGAPAFAAPASCRIIRLDDIDPHGVDPGLPPATTGEDTAYLLRTSGSTGTPKLVAISRRSLNNYLRWVADTLLVGEGGALPVVSSPIFDASFKQLLGPQYCGRPTWLLGNDPTDPAQAFADLAAADAPFSLNCTPTYWAEMLDIGGNARRRPPLAKLLLGGETVSDALLQRTVKDHPTAAIWNFYGPTETTATATAGRLMAGHRIHVGQPIAGAIVTVVDRYRRPLPLGMRGEVWIAGPGVGKGYVGFVEPNPFDKLRIGERNVSAYRSGDAGSIAVDGTLHLAGRIDAQLKLRGWRIEPQEIERVAEKAPGVVSAKLVLDPRGASPQLRLFFLGDADEATVSAGCREWLPTAMIPTTVTRLARFPRTATGKLDENALLEMISARREASPSDYDALQLEVATIWRELIGHGWPHVDDDFFNAGGHSLLLARLVNQLRGRGHDSISLRQVVRSPTVQSIAAAIRGARTDAYAEAAPVAR